MIHSLKSVTVREVVSETVVSETVREALREVVGKAVREIFDEALGETVNETVNETVFSFYHQLAEIVRVLHPVGYIPCQASCESCSQL